MKTNTYYKKLIIAAVLFIISIFLYTIASRMEGIANWYFSHIYTYLSSAITFVTGLFPFSVVEFLIYTLLILCVILIYRGIRKVSKKENSMGNLVVNSACNVLLFVGCLVFLYVVNCGMNYYRDPFIHYEQIEETQYEASDLVDVCTWLTEEINAVVERLDINEDKTTSIVSNARQVAKESMEAMGKTYPSLSGYYPKPKALVVSEILSYQQVSGIYSPFTVEANYNADMPEYMQPHTMCHELSHLKGIMREEEANFVAFLACMNTEDVSFRYSGLMHAYTNCMSELSKYDAEAFTAIRKQLNEQSNQDILSKYEFWEQYEGTIAEFSNKVNDVYLKANSQELGVNSYNEVTGLIVTYYKELRK